MSIEEKILLSARLQSATEGLNRAIELSDEVLASYYLGLSAGVLSMVASEEKAEKIFSVFALGVHGLNREVSPVLREIGDELRAQIATESAPVVAKAVE